MGLFGFGKKKTEKKSESKFNMHEFHDLKWEDEAVKDSPLAGYRNYCKMPSLRYMPMPATDLYNHWTGKTEFMAIIDAECPMAQKYPELYHNHALPIKGYEKNFYPFSENTMQLVEDILREFEKINNIEGIRTYMAIHPDEVVIATGEWFLGDHMGENYLNDETYEKIMKEREIRLYGRKEIL